MNGLQMRMTDAEIADSTATIQLYEKRRAGNPGPVESKGLGRSAFADRPATHAVAGGPCLLDQIGKDFGGDLK